MKICSPPRETIGLALAAILLFAGRAGAEPWKFAVMGDSRGAKAGQGSKDGARVAVIGPIAADAVRQKVSFIVYSGDLVQGGAASGSLTTQLTAWKEAMAPVYAAGIPVYTCRGNHEARQGEGRDAAVKAWKDFFPELPQNGPPGQEGLTYRVEHENATIIAFDQYIGMKATGLLSSLNFPSPKTGMVSPWVIEQIKAAKTPWVFAFAHEMAFPGHHTDCLADAAAERNALWDALGEKGGVYLSGHDHLYVRRLAPDGAHRPVLELVVGCAGAPPYAYDNFIRNDGSDKPYMPSEGFVNSDTNQRTPNSRAKKNTNGLPGYFGYVVLTIDGAKMTGEWRALTNYDREEWTMNGEPKFEVLDTFTWPVK